MRIKRSIQISSIILFFLTTTIFSNVVAQTIPDRPVPPRLVNDFAKILNSKETRALEKKLVRFNDTTSNQIAVVIVNSLDGYTPFSFATEIGLQWKVGRKEFDNGIVVLVKPKTSTDKGEVYIAVGYGLEPAIPDAITKRIINNEMIPSFQQGDYYVGINKATSVLMKLASGEISSKDYQNQSGGKGLVSLLPFIVIIIIIIIIRGSRGRSQSIGSGGSGSLWTALLLGSMLSGRSSNSGSWSSFSGGGSGFGGGGGGFGGFGGGSFGGGGAGGSW